MPIDGAELYALHIPFRVDFAHSQAKRFASDSLIFKVSAGLHSGYGEAVVRDYVSGAMGAGNVFEQAAKVATRMLRRLATADLSVETIRDWNSHANTLESELPIHCAIETALLDLLCCSQKMDIYTLLQKEPVRNTLIYGGTLPMLPPEAARMMLEQYKMVEIKNLRLKIGNDLDVNRNLVALARSILGDGFDLRVDANGAWEVNDALENLTMLTDFGIKTVEEPFGRDSEKILRCLDDARSDGFTFVADESILTVADLDEIMNSHTYTMLNIRLSKNGGLLKSLEIDERAIGISTQLGCHVGETGILSAAGRVAASLMRDPVYVDGSYDAHLLSENVTAENLSFSRGGHAEVIRGRGLGFVIDENALDRLSYDHHTCL